MSNHITFDDFEEKYTLITNHLDTNASFGGCMFESYGKEVEHVLEQSKDKVWTWVDGDKGTYLVQGFRSVNRIGYLITEEAYLDGDTQEYLVDLHSDMGDED